MATVLHPLYFPPDGSPSKGNIKQLYRDASGFTLSVSEGPEVKNTQRLKEDRERVYKDKLEPFMAHIKLGNQPGHLIRVHFLVDREINKLVVGIVVDHLPIYSSKMNGDRR